MKKLNLFFILALVVIMISPVLFNSSCVATNKKKEPVSGIGISFSLEIVKENNLYGVKSSIPVFSEKLYIIEPQDYDSIVLYGPNPGNTYIIAQKGKEDVLFDKYGFSLAAAEEITPVFLSDNLEVGYFILKYEDSYALYKCPEKYELKQESDSKSNQIIFKPFTTKIEKNSKLIQVVNNGSAIRCIKQDDSVEIIRII
ncbi:MAG: hypothetical protein PHH37_11805 [Paludibacter sp.]|nr:hypothetical protein [Paludibacter sp.]